jgi:Tfp pilus assembly protein PilO
MEGTDMPKTQTERLWLLGGAVLAILIVLIGYVMLISPQNSNTSSAQSQVSSAKTDNALLRVRINSLRQQNKNLAQFQAELTTAHLALPDTSGLPDFLRTLQSIGNATLATVSALAVGSPTDVTGVAGGATTSAKAGSSSPASGQRIYALPISAQVTGTTDQLNQFLTQLQSVQPRAVLISGLTEGAGATSASGTQTASGSASTLQLTMQAFVAPNSAAEKAQLSAASGK